MKIRLITIVFLMFVQTIMAQVKTKEVLTLFSKSEAITWEALLPDGQKVPLLWQERPNSIKGIRTFVAYQNNEMLGVLSIDSKGVSGTLRLLGKSYKIISDKAKVKIQEDVKIEGNCGQCCGNNHRPNAPQSSALEARRILSEDDEVTKKHKVESDGVVRVYRLALLITYNYYNGHFRSDVSKIKQFWAETEVFLNELYHRDLSVRFEIVDNEKLIYKAAGEDPFYFVTSPYSVYNRGTTEINKRIPKESYDVGMVIYTNGGNVHGLASTAAVYEKNTKGNGVATADQHTIAHEMGHLFGSLHTFSYTNLFAYYSEPDRGRSIMSYGFGSLRDYFSLVSIAVIRKRLSRTGYYTDTNRTQLIKGVDHFPGSNIPYGIKPNNTPPIINRAKIKEEYQLPHNTAFQFYIPAIDAEQTTLNYYAHQVGGTDFPNFSPPAKFLSFKPTQTGNVVFEKSYSKNNYSPIADSEPTGTGVYRFWLAVNDANISDKNHGVYYDQTYTKVNIVQGTPFKIKSGYKAKYSAGEKVTFTWDVDNTIFANTKVRILMSDDFGETYKYVLVASTDNDGSAEVTIPSITLGKKQHFTGITSGLGIIKIEVIDHIAHDITNNNPQGGGFEIEPSKISFQNTPQPTLYVKETNVPTKADVTATSTCAGNTSVAPVYSEQVTDTLIVRTWEATDTCGNKAQFVQHIYVQKDIPLSFVEALPSSQDISYGQSVPAAVTLTATGGCQGETPKVQFRETFSEGECRSTIVRTWTATSACADPISHTQVINVIDNIPPAIFGSAPAKVINVQSESQVPSQENISVVDNDSKNKRSGGSPYSMEKLQEERLYDNGVLTKVIYKWKTNDFCGNELEFEQTINVGATNHQPQVAFVNFPADENLSCGQAIPVAATTLEISGCNTTSSVNVSSSDQESGDCQTGKTISRTYTATACGQTITKIQTITITGDNQKPTFNGSLPGNFVINENESVPNQENITATDNCTQNVVVTKNRSQNGNTITDTWTATDNCGNTESHSRTITIVPVVGRVSFSNFPADEKLPCGSPKTIALTTLEISGCNGTSSVNVSSSDQESGDCRAGKTIRRTYTATACGQTITRVQTITIVGDNQKPTFSTLPSDISLNENESVPNQEDLTATDNCTQNVSVTKSRSENGNTITDTWTATDNCGNTASHSRTIRKYSNITPPSGGNTPSVKPKVLIYNVVSLQPNSENYLRIEPVEKYQNIEVEVFNEMGHKVFESRDYQRTGNVFRGFANVNGVFGKGKSLPSGTYFYVMKYKDTQGISHTKTGYVFVR